MFDNKQLTYWTIIYDSDPGLVYYFTDFNKVISSVEGSLYGYIIEEDNEEANEAIKQCIELIKKAQDAPIVPIIFGTLQIMINKWVLEKECEITKILMECYKYTDDYELRERIEKLFLAEA